MTKKYIKRAEADVGFMMVAYNLRRLINIIGKNELIKYLKEILSFYQLKKLLLSLGIFILSHLMCETKYYSYFSTKLVTRKIIANIKLANGGF